MATEIGRGTISVGFDPQQVEQAGREQLLPSAQRLATDLAATFAAVKLIDFGKSGLAELEQSQKVSAQTAVQLKATGDTAGVTAVQIDTLGQSMLDLAGFDDEAARSAANVLTRFQAFQGFDGLKRVEGDAADLAVTMGTDLPAAAQTLGQILQSPENAARRLRPIIGDLTQAQKDAIEAFTNAGDVESAQQVILEAIEARVKGAAAAYGETLPGQIDKATQSWNNAKAELVSGFAPAIELGANLTTKFAETIQSMPEPVQELAGGLVLVGGTAASLVSPISSLVNIYTQLGERSAKAALATTELATAEAASSTGFAASLGPIGLVVAGLGVLATVLALGGDKEHNAAVETANYTQALTDQNGAVDESIDKTSVHQLSLNDAAKSAANAGVSYSAMSLAIRTGTDDFDKYRSAAAESTFLNDSAAEGLKKAGAGATEFGRELIGAAESGKLSNQGVRDLLETLSGLHGTLLENKSATDAESTGLRESGIAAQVTGAAMLQLKTAEDVAAQSAKDLTAAQQASNQERSTRLSSVQALFDAERQQVSAEQQLTQAQRGVTDALRGVDDARQRVTDSIRSQNDAVQRLTDAEKALQKAQQPADTETVGKAELALSDARLRQAEAQAAVTKAEKDVANARKDGKHSAADVAELDLKVQEAKNNVTSANFGLIDAEKALQDVQKKGTEQDQAVIDAKKQVEQAERNVEDAARGVADAQRGVADAQQRVVDARSAVEGAYLGIATAAAGVKDKQDALYTGTSNATTSLYNQVSAFDEIRDKLDPSSPLRKNIDGYIGDLAVLRDIFSLDSSVPTEDILGRHTSAGQVSTRAGGGSLGPNQLFRGAEVGAELLVHDGIYQAPPGDSYVLTDDETRALFDGYDRAQSDAMQLAGAGLGATERGSRINWYGDVINPVPEPASSSVAHQLAILADRLEMAY